RAPPEPRRAADLEARVGPAARGQPVRASLRAARSARAGRRGVRRGPVRLLVVTAGAGGMYCGSCLRDNTLATELLARGHDVILLPVYTPTRTDEPNVSNNKVFFGGISVYLEQYVPMFRHTPRWLDGLWDSKAMLKLASKRSLSVRPKMLGKLTVSMLKGE